MKTEHRQHPVNGRFHIFNDRKLIFLPIAKVACTSIKITMAKAYPQVAERMGNIMKMTQSERDEKKVSIYRINTWKGSGVDIVRGSIPEKKQSYFKAAFVRNPFTRLVSCYQNKLVDTRLFVHLYGGLEHVSIVQDMPFRAFVDEMVSFRTTSSTTISEGKPSLFARRAGSSCLILSGVLKTWLMIGVTSQNGSDLIHTLFTIIDRREKEAPKTTEAITPPLNCLIKCIGIMRKISRYSAMNNIIKTFVVL